MAAAIVYFRGHGKGPTTTKTVQATKEQPFVNSLGMKFVPVPGTDVLFCIHETRKTDYASFAKTAMRQDDSWEKPVDRSIAREETGNHPVVNVNEADAQAFCAWLGSKDGLVYRLPTDYEWSCAVGIADREDATMSPKNKAGGIRNVYPWGTEWPPPVDAGNFADSFLGASTLKVTPPKLIEGYTDGYAGTAPVMSFRPNHLGIYDLAGNVWEPCSDWFDSTQTSIAVRGGCWDNAPEGDLLSCSRLPKPSGARNALVGFRVVVERRTPAGSPAPLLPVSKTTPATATKDAPFINTLGMEFVPVPGTKVLFSMHPTRVKEYSVFAGNTPALSTQWKVMPPGENLTSLQNEYPVANVSWNDVQAFCSWLSNKEGRKYRLPTDREWSFAAGIGTMEEASASMMPKNLSGTMPDQYPWGAGWPPPKGAGNFADEFCAAKKPGAIIIPGYVDGYANRSPVMSFEPNVFGLYDMGGNLRQWCEDWYDETRTERVVRGSSWGDQQPEHLLSSYRSHFPPSKGRDTEGFRCVLEIENIEPAGKAN